MSTATSAPGNAGGVAKTAMYVIPNKRINVSVRLMILKPYRRGVSGRTYPTAGVALGCDWRSRVRQLIQESTRVQPPHL